jgi:DNA primase
VLVVEGYADCVACHQYGVANVVATLGTSLTESHCSRLRSFAQNIVLLYDADEAGQRAAARGVGMLLGQSVDLRVLTLPSGKDPDEYLKANSTESFRELVKQAPEAWEFRLNWEIKQKGRDSVNSREQILVEMLALLAKIPNFEGSPREAIVLGRVAAKLRLSEPEVRAQLNRVRTQMTETPVSPMKNSQQAAPAQPARVITFHRKPLSKDDKLDAELLEILITRPELAEYARREIGSDDILNLDLRELLQVVYDLLELGEEPTFDRLTLQTESNQLKSLWVWLSAQASEKGIEQKLMDAVDGVPKFFLENLQHLKWRREEMNHQAYINREALKTEQEDALARLKKASMFHQKRANPRPPQ